MRNFEQLKLGKIAASCELLATSLIKTPFRFKEKNEKF